MLLYDGTFICEIMQIFSISRLLTGPILTCEEQEYAEDYMKFAITVARRGRQLQQVLISSYQTYNSVVLVRLYIEV